ncbi:MULTISPECIES: Arc family DNA-binding protein [Pseudomonas putida group]|uniref:Arc family DNA-binding protein n=1 Tax=Pseudomonas putida group TaxID=136845 RepID=UPI001E35D51D|nr:MULTISPECIES: Arc family DNA-binding protein [Pseudomonas putida group]MCL8299591.1 Arc family DNA-binding protein [Pseudomonas mosselii]MCL8339974.1 Arc family DNA-binding protein [Pseudomonas mosselii]WJR30062.1 Arc family DNA-binding protein [Pseudomonas mosselii]
MAFDSHSLDKFVVRLPDGMRDQVAATAQADERSMNGLIVIAIREYLDRGQKANALLDALVLAAEVKDSVLVDQPGADFDIDEHVRMAADARRYRLLRDRERIEDPDVDLLVVRGDNWLSGEELDQEIDTGLRLQSMQQQVVQEQQS